MTPSSITVASTWRPSWSPDSMWIAFVGIQDGNEEIYRINIDGTGLLNLTNHPAADNDPHISPDGSMIAFVS